jgi:hypothetical protein
VSHSRYLLRRVSLPNKNTLIASKPKVYSSLTVGWASSLLAFVALALSPIPWIFSLYCPKLRATTKYSPSRTPQQQQLSSPYLRQFQLGAPTRRFEDPRPAPQPPRRVEVRPVGAHPPTTPVEQPIDLFFNGPAYRTSIHVCIMARPVAPLVSSLSNRPQWKNTPAALRGGFG